METVVGRGGLDGTLTGGSSGFGGINGLVGNWRSEMKFGALLILEMGDIIILSFSILL
jgi:hypothetical protein